MVINTKDFKECCTKILSAIDNSELSTLTETLELITKDDDLYLNVTNAEYYVSVVFPLDHEEEFHATVNAILFLKLISQVTTENIEIIIKDTYIQIKANGTYKLPLIFDGDHLLELPKIVVENPSLEMSISGDILQSILNYNSKELLKGTFAQPVQKMYYLDQQGCLTFTSGACVNNFTLEKPIKLLLPDRIVKLFKLFKNSLVQFSLGHSAITESLIQTKIAFETTNIKLYALLSGEDSLLNSVPTDTIRKLVTDTYDYSLTINKDLLLEAINRLLLFSKGYGENQIVQPYGIFTFNNGNIEIWDSKKENVENISYAFVDNKPPYTFVLRLLDLSSVLDSCSEKEINLKFGNHTSVIITRGNISNVIPESTIKEENGI